MTIDPLYLFVFAGLFSPGPNVILLTASGARFGFRATLPHVSGVAIGVGVTSALMGAGIGALLLAFPVLTLALKLIAAGWILYMAWGLLRANQLAEGRAEGKPFTLLQAILFQWVNPKVWAVALAAAAGYTSHLAPGIAAAKLGATFSGLNLFVCLFWSFAGSLLALLLTTPRAWTLFRLFMAALLAASAAMVFL